MCVKLFPGCYDLTFFRYRMKNKIHRPRGPSLSNEPQYVVFVFPKQTSAPQVLACQFTMQGREAGNHTYFFSFPVKDNQDVSFGELVDNSAF